MDRKGLFFIACTSGMLFVANFFISQQSIKQKAEKLAQQEQIQQLSLPRSAAEPELTKDSPGNSQNTPGEFFVLENHTLQLVIEAKKGNLTEINLPLQSKNHPHSAIKPVEFDKQIEVQSPQIAYFPLICKESRASRFDSEGKSHVVLPQKGGYYPLLRRVDWNQAASKTQNCFLSGQISSSKMHFEDLEFYPHQVSNTHLVLKTCDRLKNITKTIALIDTVPNCFEIEVAVEDGRDDLWLSSGVPEVEMLSGASTPQIKYQIEKGGNPTTIKASLPSQKSVVNTIHPDWICNSNGFFGLIMRPVGVEKGGFKIEKLPGTLVPSRLSSLDQTWNRFPMEKFPGYQIHMPLFTSNGKSKYQFFAGPLSKKLLNEIDHTLSKRDGGVDPHFSNSQSFHGWLAFISQPFAKLLIILMNGFFKITHSWALSICLLTVALRIMLYPLNSWSMISTKRMRELAPSIQKVQEKYKKEPQRAQREVLQLYRDNKINPLSGCLPLLLQMPFLIGMFDLLKTSFELRGASFIPGWIDDLSAPDVLFTWSTPVPFFGHELHILPLLVGLAMYWQQSINGPQVAPGDERSEQQNQQKMIGNIMTVVFAAMFYHFPSGLNIYWLSSILLGIGQQFWFQRAASSAIKGTKSA